MGGELLAIVQAERQADSILKDALERKERSLQQALAERKRLLEQVSAPEIPLVMPRKTHPDTARIKRMAAKNRARAVAKILEAVHAQA